MKFRPLHIVCIALSFLLAACSIPSESPVGDFGSVRDYFWSVSDERQLQYNVYNGLTNAPVVHNVELRAVGDTIFAKDEANGQTGIVTSRLAANGVFLTDIQSTALFPLPEGAYISKSDREEKITKYLPVSNFILTKGQTVAFTPRGIFTSTSYQNWERVDTTITDNITAIASSPERSRFYAGSGSGDVYFSEDEGRRWIHLFNAAGPIRGIAVADDGTLYAGVSGFGVASWEGGQQLSYGTALPSKNVTGLALRPSAGGQDLVVSTSEGLFYLTVGEAGKWRTLNNELQRSVRGIYSSRVSMLAVLDNGQYKLSHDTGHTWSDHSIDLLSGEQISSASIDELNLTFATDGGRVYHSIDGQTPLLLGDLNVSVNAARSPGNGEVLAASQRGLISVIGSQSLTDVGPFVNEIDSTRGEFKLLHSNTGVLTLNDSWSAGTIFLPNGPLGLKYFPITARVIDHLDSLQVDDQEFSDVFVVRYGFEHSDSEIIGPQWLLYFSRGLGPVMIDRVANSAGLYDPVSRAIYIHKP